jgi:hypothetical protein
MIGDRCKVQAHRSIVRLTGANFSPAFALLVEADPQVRVMRSPSSSHDPIACLGRVIDTSPVSKIPSS